MVTHKLGVIGHPIGHSRSPVIHRYWLDRYGIDGCYDAVPVAPDDLDNFLKNKGKLEFYGMNLTIPHKETALSCLDKMDETCRLVGAVNTIKIENARLQGFNTDCFGFIENLREKAPQALPLRPTQTKSGEEENQPQAAILGAGGAAKACIVALCQAGYKKILIINRTPERARALVETYRSLPLTLSYIDWDARSACLDRVALLVNATSLGMRGFPPLSLDLTRLAPHAVVYDLIYAPLQTPLLKAATERGLTAVNGLGMLVHQARQAFSLWFDILPEADAHLYALLAQSFDGSQ